MTKSYSTIFHCLQLISCEIINSKKLLISQLFIAYSLKPFQFQIKSNHIHSGLLLSAQTVEIWCDIKLMTIDFHMAHVRWYKRELIFCWQNNLCACIRGLLFRRFMTKWHVDIQRSLLLHIIIWEKNRKNWMSFNKFENIRSRTKFDMKIKVIPFL